MVTKGSWLVLDQMAYESDEVQELKGVKVHMLLSPYDMPEAFRLKADEVSKQLRAEFRYLSDEPRDFKELEGSAYVEIGKNSGRLYAIGLKDDDGHFATAMGRAEGVVTYLLTHFAEKDMPRANYEVAKRVIHDKWADVARDMAALQNTE